jgi:transposase
MGRETLSKWLRTADIKPHRFRYWLNSKDPDFQAKMRRVVDLYVNKPRVGRVICLDEKTCIPARERVAPDKPTKPGQIRRQEFEYRRHGTVHLLAAYEVHTGRVVAKCVDKNDSRAFIQFLRDLRKVFPRETLHLVMDNASTHRSKKTTAFLESHPRMVPVFLPTHASWLNQIEIWFSVLTRQALRGVSFSSRAELIDLIHEYIEEHNRTAAPYKWTMKGTPLTS